jgi:hypothetical protein
MGVTVGTTEALVVTFIAAIGGTNFQLMRVGPR